MRKGTSGKQKQDSKLKRKISESEKYIREFALNNNVSIKVAKIMLQE